MTEKLTPNEIYNLLRQDLINKQELAQNEWHYYKGAVEGIDLLMRRLVKPPLREVPKTEEKNEQDNTLTQQDNKPKEAAIK